MPMLKNYQREMFAQGRARGMTQKAAHTAAGYTGKDPSAASRMEKVDEVTARIAELREGAVWSVDDDLGPLIDELGVLTRAAGKKDSAAAFVAARGLIAEAARLKILRADRALASGAAFEDLPRSLNSEEWLAEYGAKR